MNRALSFCLFAVCSAFGANRVVFAQCFLCSDANSNTTVGTDAFLSNSSGTSNNASGYGALQASTSGSRNNAAGAFALANSNASDNNAVGYVALYKDTSGTLNNAVGNFALTANTTGSNNIAVGQYAGDSLTTGNSNIDIGNSGVAGESGVIRVGSSATHVAAYMAGISNSTITGAAVYEGAEIRNMRNSAIPAQITGGIWHG
jgi:trimeric autotransporter adhesin